LHRRTNPNSGTTNLKLYTPEEKTKDRHQEQTDGGSKNLFVKMRMT
jgi:hypothetical protein